jgi:hypothetical protein
MLQIGPNELYRWYGYSSFSPKAHLNSIDLCVMGKKTVSFQDGSKIEYTPHQDKFSNTLFGTLNHLLTGRCEFKDEKNGISAWYEIGSVKKKPKDYFGGEILKDGEVVCKIFGNYMGYIDIDDKRYWDVRDCCEGFEPVPIPQKELSNPDRLGSLPIVLPSDATKRIDSLALSQGNVEQA